MIVVRHYTVHNTSYTRANIGTKVEWRENRFSNSKVENNKDTFGGINVVFDEPIKTNTASNVSISMHFCVEELANIRIFPAYITDVRERSILSEEGLIINPTGRKHMPFVLWSLSMRMRVCNIPLWYWLQWTLATHVATHYVASLGGSRRVINNNDAWNPSDILTDRCERRESFGGRSVETPVQNLSDPPFFMLKFHFPIKNDST